MYKALDEIQVMALLNGLRQNSKHKIICWRELFKYKN